MSLLTAKSANIVGGAPQGGFFNNLTVHGKLTLVGNCATPLDNCNCCFQVAGGAISDEAPAATLASKYLQFNVGGVSYKSGMLQNTIVT